MAHLSKEYTTLLQLLQILRSLPYGNSVFFSMLVRLRIPLVCCLGALFWESTNEGYTSSVLSPGNIYIQLNHQQHSLFQNGEDICVALQTHISDATQRLFNDIMLRRYTRNHACGNNNAPNSGASTNNKPPGMEAYKKHVQECVQTSR